MELEKVKLKNIGRIVTGCTPKTKKEEYYKTKDYMFVGPTDLKLNKYVRNSEKYISNIAYKDYSIRFIDNNSVMVDCIGSDMGNVALSVEKLLTNQQINSITEIDETRFNVEYIYYVLSTMKKYFHQIGTNGSTMPIINKTMFEEIEIALPKKHIQDKIVKILSSIDNKIELNNRINANLHEMAENLFLQIYQLGKEEKLDELLYEIQTGSRQKGGAVDKGIPSIGAEKIEKLGVYDFSSEKYISEEYYNKMRNGIIKSGDVLLYKDGAYTGKVSMALNDFPHKKCAINEHVFILRTEKNWANMFLYFLLNYSKVKEQIISRASSKAAQPGLNQVELKSVVIKLPEKELIEKFENKVKPIAEKIIQNSLENRTLAKLRDTLLQKLMNGEIDLDKIEI